MARAAQPTAGQRRVRRRPKCHARGGAVKEANRTAVPMKIADWSSVAMIVNAGDSSPEVVPVAAAAMPTTMKVATSPTRNALIAYQAGQRGAASDSMGLLE